MPDIIAERPDSTFIAWWAGSTLSNIRSVGLSLKNYYRATLKNYFVQV
jgi:hypothetical protein